MSSWIPSLIQNVSHPIHIQLVKKLGVQMYTETVARKLKMYPRGDLRNDIKCAMMCAFLGLKYFGIISFG